MMDRFKFRVWDKAEREYCQVSEYESRHWFDRFDPAPIFDSLVLQQFTGLLDKNGKEIYEGDILTICESDDPEDLSWEIYTVIWQDGEYVLEEDMASLNYYILEDRVDAVVIGNIYENPELLIKH